MRFKTLLTTLLFGVIIFLLIVGFGIKYNWVEYLESDSDMKQEVTEAGQLPLQPTAQESAVQPEAKKPRTEQFELIEEANLSSDAEEQIRNDCIRASRRAGVGDDRIFAVVNQCVEMSRKSQPQVNPMDNTNSANIGLDNEPRPIAQEQESNDLTRRACEIVADRNPNLTPSERLQQVDECVRSNSR